MKKDNHRRCFESEAGAPTLTIEVGSGHRMIPYSSFESAEFDGTSKIRISFNGCMVEIEGKQLDDVWEKLQMLDLKALRVSRGQTEEDCSISKLRCVEPES